MRLIICVSVLLALAFVASAEQQRILRRVIKSTPTATNLARIRQVTIRSPGGAESGVVTEISSKEAANFGQRSNETAATPATQQAASGTKSKAVPAPVAQPTQTTTSTTSTAAPTTEATTSTTTGKPETSKPKASDRQQAAPQGAEVELLSGAPSSWQTMTAVEAPAAMLIATGTRAASASSSSDLSSSSSSTVYSSEESASQAGDFLRASSTKGASRSQVGETFSRLRQQAGKQQQQQAYFYPQETRASGKTNTQTAKTAWYQPTTSAPRPAPVVQEQQYEQQAEQYVEQQQQQQVEYGAAPLGQAEPFAFDFNTKDNSGNGQYRKEESDKNGVVRGSYGYTDANGIYRHVEYVADQNGFRANIKSNEPGLIGETQPASIQLAGGAAPQQADRLSAPRASSQDNSEWVPSAASSSPGASADLALAPPDFESSHKPERARVPRHFRN